MFNPIFKENVQGENIQGVAQICITMMSSERHAWRCKLARFLASSLCGLYESGLHGFQCKDLPNVLFGPII